MRDRVIGLIMAVFYGLACYGSCDAAYLAWGKLLFLPHAFAALSCFAFTALGVNLLCLGGEDQS